jgi:uncharacterized flavoprotein (TIGR03862 family)
LKAASVAIVGAGPAGLFAAECLAEKGLSVTVYDRMPSPARKFLLAGRGGLNLTHSEPLDAFLTRYGEAQPLLQHALTRFSPDDLRQWAHGLGEETFTGTSGRVFPKSFKASPLLRAWLRRLDGLGVRLFTRHEWRGFGEDGSLLFATPDGEVRVAADAVLLALGGVSWPRLGADGGWVAGLRAQGIEIVPFEPANSGWLIPWTDHVRRFAGTPLKRVALTIGAETARGDAMLTETGLEGGPVYALGACLRTALAKGDTRVAIDLRPDLDESALTKKLDMARKGASMAKRLTQAGLTPAMQAVLRDAGPLPNTAQMLAARIKDVPLDVTGVAGLDRAISSAGGIARGAINAHMALKARPNVFVAGEMLDWEAPTGGYLLQGCFATAALAADGIVAFLRQR